MFENLDLSSKGTFNMREMRALLSNSFSLIRKQVKVTNKDTKRGEARRRDATRANESSCQYTIVAVAADSVAPRVQFTQFHNIRIKIEKHFICESSSIIAFYSLSGRVCV